MEEVNCGPVMGELLTCMTKNEYDPTKCVESKKALAKCMEAAYISRNTKSSFWGDVSKYVFSLDRRNMFKSK